MRAECGVFRELTFKSFFLTYRGDTHYKYYHSRPHTVYVYLYTQYEYEYTEYRYGVLLE